MRRRALTARPLPMRRQLSLLLLAATALAATALAAPTPARPGETSQGPPRVVGLEATLEGHRVLLDWTLERAFDRRFRDRLESGLPTGFTFELELLRDRKRWFDRGLEEATLEVTAMYNALTDEYLINYELDGALIESRLLHDKSEVEPAMTVFVRMPVFDLEEGQEVGRRLLVRARAVLGDSTVLGFIPSRDTTDWLESHKFRVRAES